MVRRQFYTLDVFTRQRFSGNPLAVVLEADALEQGSMQAIAREFNFSETVFVLAPERAAHRGKLRIFTPLTEIAFAGHPTVGTAVLLSWLDRTSADQEFVLEERIGAVRCSIEAVADDGGRARFDLPRLPYESGPAPSTAQLAAALGLESRQIGFASFMPGCWSAGVPITFVPVCDLQALRCSRINPVDWAAIEPASAVYVFCRETVERSSHFHARMFAPGLGVPEDPATGAAVAALAGVLGRHGQLPDADHHFTIEQGDEMGRPSRINLGLTMHSGELVRAAVGGDAVLVSEGSIAA